MPQIKCPRCGAANSTRAPDYPFCVGCQDNLAKCGCCYWFETQIGACHHPTAAGVFEVSPEATPPCGYHEPRPSARRRKGGLALTTAGAGLAAAVFVLGWGVMKTLRPAAPAAAPAGDLQLLVEADYQGARVGELFPVVVQIYNSSAAVVEGVRLEVAKESLTGFELVRESPPGVAKQAGQWLALDYPRLGPHERRTITLELIPRRSGRQQFVVQLMSEGGYHGRAELPIAVAGERSSGPVRKEGEDNHEAR